jgi:hypothetical protein
VYATAYGYTATNIKPPAGQSHYEIVDGETTLRAFHLRPHLTAADMIYRLRQKRNAVVAKWGEAIGNDRSAAADLTPWGPLDRMWRLTAAIDHAIVRLGGEV